MLPLAVEVNYSIYKAWDYGMSDDGRVEQPIFAKITTLPNRKGVSALPLDEQGMRIGMVICRFRTPESIVLTVGVLEVFRSSSFLDGGSGRKRPAWRLYTLTLVTL